MRSADADAVDDESALVVYESSFGNTAKVAEAVADGLGRHMPVRVVAVDEPGARQEADDTLVVVGGPTHAFSMSRPRTRREAQERADTLPRDTAGIRDWIDMLPADRPDRLYATFDTRVAGARHLPGSAARAAERELRRGGHRTVVHGESFYVADVEGPLLPDEAERARAWGEHLAREAADVRRRP
ncbi:flavodoxin family protein [Isoptericola sp. BMS4]|uniref:flavodoxin family protein n=1 Tax=Isoptericola sp. BMS4 TaxID=2527875 RepID=UPI001F10479C|nr:flavodoxin family protein [Isoptericola sp. BMS4]